MGEKVFVEIIILVGLCAFFVSTFGLGNMNYSANIRIIAKVLLPKKMAYALLKYVVLLSVWLYQIKLRQKILLRSDTSDVNVFAEIFLFQDYNFKLPITPKTIVDAGANVGYGSLWFHKRYPLAQIIAIEPEHSNYQLLLGNTSKYSNIQTLEKGLWHKKAKLKIINKEGSKYGFITEEVNAENEKGDIETCNINELLGIFNNFGLDTIDVLKIDIEGAEKEVFSGNRGWLSKTKVVIIELHDETRSGCKEVFINAMNEFGFSLLIERGENIVYVNNNLI
ncbi:MAG: FkbM family methyltransferase [Gammaproteobacteria bacterium]|nr:FkbM family methyltransferase [Gammaproteobacteria bacterium]